MPIVFNYYYAYKQSHPSDSWTRSENITTPFSKRLDKFIDADNIILTTGSTFLFFFFLEAV